MIDSISEETLIVKSYTVNHCAKNVPVFINSYDLTAEVAKNEDVRLARQVQISLEKIDEVIESIFSASGPSVENVKDQAKFALCRLLLGPVSIPCYCEEWDVNFYLTKCSYNCEGPVLYIYKNASQCCESTYRFSIMTNYHSTHIFRGLLSLQEWNSHLSNILCTCSNVTGDKYTATIFPNNASIYLEYYPYFLCYLCKHLSIIDIEQCTNELIAFLGPKTSQRIIIHYKLLFGFRSKPMNFTVSLLEQVFTLEIQKLYYSVSKHNSTTADFFNVITAKFAEDKYFVLRTFKLSAQITPGIQSFCSLKFKLQTLYLNLKIMKNTKLSISNSFYHGKTLYTLDEKQLVWRNLLLIYYGYNLKDNVKQTQEESLLSMHYIRILERLSLKSFREINQQFRFEIPSYQEKTLQFIPGGNDFAEITSVTHGETTVNAFNTNRVMNVKAALSGEIHCVLHRIPKSMTHSFVMYKRTFKEPSLTVSTFISNDDFTTSSLNINIRGPYCDFLYALGVYRLHVNIQDFFLPAFVCNSNNSMDLHGLENQGIVRKRKKKVYWITNFPCMISNSEKVNVGWFKAGTGIIPKVSGTDLKNVLLKELISIGEIPNITFDMDLHALLTLLEKRNMHQVPFLIKQFFMFLRLGLLVGYGRKQERKVHHIMLFLIQKGFFDFSKNSVANSKIKHACALVGSRLANNVPKILSKQKKMKLDHLGRNANALTVLRFIVENGYYKRKTIFCKLLKYLATTSFNAHVQTESNRLLNLMHNDSKTNFSSLERLYTLR